MFLYLVILVCHFKSKYLLWKYIFYSQTQRPKLSERLTCYVTCKTAAYNLSTSFHTKSIPTLFGFLMAAEPHSIIVDAI